MTVDFLNSSHKPGLLDMLLVFANILLSTQWHSGDLTGIIKNGSIFITNVLKELT